jgi:AcrR family transcriptional regulator
MEAGKGVASVRERLLAAANELFYQEGVHTVGIDRVLEKAGVAKASLYGTFGSKEELVRAYLEQRAASRRERISTRIAQYVEPRDRILSIFDLLAEIAAEPTFRGCAFVNASAEAALGSSAILQVCSGQREWVRNLFSQLARDLGIRNAERMGRRLSILYDGALTGAKMDSDPGIVRETRAMVEEFIDAAMAPGAEKTRSRASKRAGEASKQQRRAP